MSEKHITDQSKQFQDKIIIVTGSTQGSGAETAKLLEVEGLKELQYVGVMKKKETKLKKKYKNLVQNVFILKQT